MSAVMEDGAQLGFRDKKRYLWPLSLVYPLAPLVGLGLHAATGIELFNWYTIVLWYVLMPFLDYVLGTDKNNPPESAVRRLEADRYYRYLTYATVPIHYVVFLLGAWAVGTWELGWAGYLGLALSVGVSGGLAINTGHELGHKQTPVERWLAKAVLAVVGYGHFYVEHNRGHHKHVATPEDSASARFGESIYRFVLREVPGGISRAWSSEKERLARRGKSAWSLENEVLQPLLITAVMYGALIALFGPVMIPFLIIQAAFGWWQLTSANYVEHYGLLRQKRADGRYERCQPHHSWNSNYRMSNLVLFHLQRHSDHHAWPTRRYQALRNFEDVPTLPGGYPAMFIAALIPPLWRAVMDPRVLEIYDGDLSRINIDPRKREALERRYGKQERRAA